MRLSDKVARLGTESAFSVAARAAVQTASGARVYPFHLGDLNLRTPGNIVEAMNQAIRDGKTGYCPNAGIAPLREALAADVNSRRGTSYGMHNVSIQPGGKPVIGKFLAAVMNPGDEVLCPSPGFPIYESQINFQGGRVLPYGFISGDNAFRIDTEAMEKAVTPATRIMIVNDFHNPTGAACSAEERRWLAGFAVRHGLLVLLDEAYFELHYDGGAESIIRQPGMAERSVILYTFSKKYAMTGWRLGAAIGPKEVIDVINTMNVNEESCTAHFVQYAGLAALTGDHTEQRRILDTLRERRDAAVDILNRTPGVKCFTPTASFYLYPDVTELMEKKGFGADYAAFAEDALVKTGLSFCTRLHFGTPLPGESRRHIRLAFSGINVEDIREGLGKFQEYASR